MSGPIDCPDALVGMSWWNTASKAARAYWLAAAGTAVPAQAWECFKRHSALSDATANQDDFTTQTKAAMMAAALGETT